MIIRSLFFVVGDTADVLDPASFHGVFKAIMSGIMAGVFNCSIGQSSCKVTD